MPVVGRFEPMLTMEAGTASVVAQLLEFLAGLPSTPGFVASEARQHASELEEALPSRRRQSQPGARSISGVVELGASSATAIAGLLDLLAGLPSTPPAVKDEARAHAERIWDGLDVDPDAEPDARTTPPGAAQR